MQKSKGTLLIAMLGWNVLHRIEIVDEIASQNEY